MLSRLMQSKVSLIMADGKYEDKHDNRERPSLCNNKVGGLLMILFI